MRCLSVRQPWAWAICSGQKNIENRTWGTDYRGQIAIHAGSSKDSLNSIRKRSSTKLDDSLFPLGAIIGVAEVLDCVLMNEELEDNPGPKVPNAGCSPMPAFFVTRSR